MLRRSEGENDSAEDRAGSASEKQLSAIWAQLNEAPVEIAQLRNELSNRDRGEAISLRAFRALAIFWRKLLREIERFKRRRLLAWTHLIRKDPSRRSPGKPPESGASTQNPLEFDANYYLARYPDVREAGVDPLHHWAQLGRHEGRVGTPPKYLTTGSVANLDPNKKTIFVVSHEASRTGAPMVALSVAQRLHARYNIVTILLDGGHLTPEFIASSEIVFQLQGSAPIDAADLSSKAIAVVRPDFVLINSVVSHGAIPAFTRASIPSVTLVHEFTSYIGAEIMENVIRWSTHVVFSAPIVLSDAKKCMPRWNPGNRCHVLAQGRCASTSMRDVERIRNAFRPAGKSSKATHVVLGAGTVSYRKGCDIFVQCAQQIIKRNPALDIKFVWIGTGYAPETDIGYSAYLSEQIRRSNLENHVTFMDEVDSLEDAYSAADVLLLTSRLDPLPNVGIDALCVGLPIICFESASGIAEVLQEESLGDFCVAPYLDSSAMADLALHFLEDDALIRSYRDRLSDIEHRRFNIDRYVSRLETLLKTSTVN